MSSSVGDLDVDVLDPGANRVDRQPVHRRDGHRVVALVDPQEPDLELQAVDRLVDVVRQPRVEDRVVVAAHLVRVLGGDGDVAQSACAGDESAAGGMSSGCGDGAGAGVDLLGQSVGSGEPQEPLDAAQRGFLVRALRDGHPVVGDAGEISSKVAWSSSCQPERDDVLGRTAPQQEAAFVVVEAESHDVGRQCRRGACRWRRGRSAASRRTSRFR